MNSKQLLATIFILTLAVAIILSLTVITTKLNYITYKENTKYSSSESAFPAVTLAEIYGPGKVSLGSLDQSKVVTLIATGDVVPGRSVNSQATKFNDFTWPWKNVANFTKAADLTYINFEVPLIENCPVTNEGMNFCGDPRHVQGLVAGGVDVANLANNHSGDRGTAGIQATTKLLTDNKIDVTGTGQILYTTIKGTKFAILGYNDITSVVNPAPADPVVITTQIKEAKRNASVVIVGFHWGIEYQALPSARQIELAHLAIDSGADLVLGNHPHTTQPVEIYKDKVITYAHGNFIFDQMWSEQTKEGVVGTYTFYGSQLVDVTFTPIKIRDYGQAYFPDRTESEQITSEMKANSEALSKSSIIHP